MLFWRPMTDSCNTYTSTHVTVWVDIISNASCPATDEPENHDSNRACMFCFSLTILHWVDTVRHLVSVQSDLLGVKPKISARGHCS